MYVSIYWYTQWLNVQLSLTVVFKNSVWINLSEESGIIAKYYQIYTSAARNPVSAPYSISFMGYLVDNSLTAFVIRTVYEERNTNAFCPDSMNYNREG